jgi:hypothetical protein
VGFSYFFAAKSNVDVTKQEISSIGVGMEFNGLRPSPAHYACDDSQQAITKNKEKLLCKPVKDVKKYRDFPVTALPAFSAEAAALGLDLNDPRHPKVQEYNFWLESELDAKLAATQQGAKP